MYKDYRGFNRPDDNTKIWRYIDFPEFISLLEMRALFFSTVELLRNTDPWEGSFSTFEFAGDVNPADDTSREMFTLIKAMTAESASKHVVINCWHVNNTESAIMWKLHLSSTEGLAIQTSFGNLTKSFDGGRPDWPINGRDEKIPIVGGAVEYIDRENFLTDADTLRPFMLKGNFFEGEQEIRLLAKLHPFVGMHPYSFSGPDKMAKDETYGLSPAVAEQLTKYKGVYIPVNLDTLIDRIYVSPVADLWFKELVGKMLDRYKAASHLSKDVELKWTNEKPAF